MPFKFLLKFPSGESLARLFVSSAPRLEAFAALVRFIHDRLTAYRSVLWSGQFGDPLLNLLKLMEKLEIGLLFGPTGVGETAQVLLLNFASQRAR